MNNQKRTYLDYNATAPIRHSVKEAMIEAMEVIGNPSSIHQFGQKAKSQLEQSRYKIAELLNCRDSNIIFTSSATEANNTILRGLPECTTVFVSATEHPSVLNANDKAQIIQVQKNGLIDLNDLEEQLKKSDGKTLISIHAVNSETGVVQPIQDIVTLTRQYGALFHCDAVQAIGRISFDYLNCGADFVTVSSHKIGGPQGIGAIIAADLRPFTPLIYGGGQEKSRRAGTENLVGVIGFTQALQSALQEREEYNDKLLPLQKEIETYLLQKNRRIEILGKDSPRVCNTINILTPGITSETQLIFMDINNIALSSGSACSSGTVKTSHVLQAMNVDKEKANCALRLSMGWNTHQADIEHFLSVFDQMLEINH